MDQYAVYKKAGLHYAVVNGRQCLVVKNIDLEYVDHELGLLNSELLKKGQAPYDSKTGKRIVIHHMRQEHNAPFAELTEDEHKDSTLHKHNDDPSWRNNTTLDKKYNTERNNHYKERIKNESIS